MSTKKCTV